MRGVILAAGRGGRLRGVAGDRPKCLVRVGDRTLIERQIRALRGVGLDGVTVVTGCCSSEVRAVCGTGIEYVDNPAFAETNSLYSFWLARDSLTDGFVVLNCDVLFDDQLLLDLLSARYEDALLVAAAEEARPYGDEEMKVIVRRGRVAGISKALSPADADAENIGIAKFGIEGAAVLIEEADRLVEAGGTREWLPRAFAAFAARRPLYAIGSRGLPWIEIDFPEDYWRACTEVLPAIESADAPLTPAVDGAPAAVRPRRTVNHV